MAYKINCFILRDYFFVKNDEILLVPLAAFCNCFSLADTFFSFGVLGMDGKLVKLGSFSSFFIRLTPFDCDSASDFRLFDALVFSKFKYVANLSDKSGWMYSLTIPNAYDNISPLTEFDIEVRQSEGERKNNRIRSDELKLNRLILYRFVIDHPIYCFSQNIPI